MKEISPDGITDQLFRDNLTDESSFQNARTTQDKNDIIIKSVLQKAKKDSKACKTFIDILETHQYKGIRDKLSKIVDEKMNRGKKRRAIMLYCIF